MYLWHKNDTKASVGMVVSAHDGIIVRKGASTRKAGLADPSFEHVGRLGLHKRYKLVAMDHV